MDFFLLPWPRKTEVFRFCYHVSRMMRVRVRVRVRPRVGACTPMRARERMPVGAHVTARFVPRSLRHESCYVRPSLRVRVCVCVCVAHDARNATSGLARKRCFPGRRVGVKAR